jgi:ABC-2 type transport system ATP-binding protein
LSEAEATCDRVVIINRGKIAADGSTANLKKSLSHKKFIHLSLQNADFKSVDKVLSTIAGISGISRTQATGHQLEVRLDCQAPADLRADIYAKIKETDWVLLDFHQESQSLESIFRELTLEGER